MRIVTHYQVVVLHSQPDNVHNKEVNELIITSELPAHYDDIKDVIMDIRNKICG
jgi:hypothetical protein